MTTTRTPGARFRAFGVALAPAVLCAALVAHPYLVRLPDPAAVADAVEQSTTRWGIVHAFTTVGSLLIALAFLAIRADLRDAGEDRFSTWALPFVISGSALYALLPVLELAPMAAVRTGGDAAVIQDALEPWFIAILASSVLLFAIGILGFARAIAAGHVLSRPLTRLVVAALVTLAVSRFVPLGVVQFYVQPVAALVALWPLAHQMWRAPSAARTGTPQPVPAG